MLKLIFCAAIALSLQAQSPSPAKAKKLAEIDQRLATLEREADALRALRASISSGQIPEAALSALSIQPASPASTTATPGPQPIRAAASAPTPAPTSSAYHLGPRGGCYTLTSGGNKRYVDRSMCQ